MPGSAPSSPSFEQIPSHSQDTSEPDSTRHRRQVSTQTQNTLDSRSGYQRGSEPLHKTKTNLTMKSIRERHLWERWGILKRSRKKKNDDGTEASQAPKFKEPTFRQSMRAIVTHSWLNVLIIFVPISWALHWGLDTSQHGNDVAVFLTAFVAIVPLASLLAWTTEELALRVGETLGGILNATFGNVVELIVGIIALVKCELSVVQSSLVGSILSNLLLVLGMCFFAGGTRYSEQTFLQTSAQLQSTLLILSVTAILIPAAFNVAIKSAASNNPTADDNEGPDILKMSHGVSLILLVIYAGSLVFQLWSHSHLYQEDQQRELSKNYPHHDYTQGERKRDKMLKSLKLRKDKDGDGDVVITAEQQDHRIKGANRRPKETQPAAQNTGPMSTVDENPPASSETSSPETRAITEEEAADLEKQHTGSNDGDDDEEEQEQPQLTRLAAFGLLTVVTVLVAVTAEFLVSAINGVTESGAISKEWVGLILLPIVGNAAEHVTAVTVSVKDKLDLSINVAVGSSIQIALFVIPVLVLLGWIIDKPLTLLFDPFQSIVLLLAVLTVTFTTNDGRSNWLEGLILMGLYVILGTAFWFYPDVNGDACSPLI